MDSGQLVEVSKLEREETRFKRLFWLLCKE